MRALVLLPAYAVVAAVVLSGCLDVAPGSAGSGGGPEYRVGGWFTENATQADFDDLRDRLEPYGADVALLESFPVQYMIAVEGADDCEEVRGMLHGLEYVASVGDCRQVDAGVDGDEPVADDADG